MDYKEMKNRTSPDFDPEDEMVRGESSTGNFGCFCFVIILIAFVVVGLFRFFGL